MRDCNGRCAITFAIRYNGIQRHYITPFMMTLWHGNAFCTTDPLWGEPQTSSEFPSQRISNTGPWCFLLCQPDQTVEEKVEQWVICDAMKLMQRHFNSLWPSDTIWRHRTGSALAQVMACCLTAPSQYLHQWWLIIRNTSTINHYN